LKIYTIGTPKERPGRKARKKGQEERKKKSRPIKSQTPTPNGGRGGRGK